MLTSAFCRISARTPALSPFIAASATGERPAPKMTNDVKAIVAIPATSARTLFMNPPGVAVTDSLSVQCCPRSCRGECQTYRARSTGDFQWESSLLDMPGGGSPAASHWLRQLRREARHSANADWDYPY